MTPFQRSKIPPEEIEGLRKRMLETPLEDLAKYFQGKVPTPRAVRVLVNQMCSDHLKDEIWLNDTYQVAKRAAEKHSDSWPDCWHLSIKRIDRQPIHDWRDLQRIKNHLVGPEHEAVEIYPAESRLVDTANQYHLFVLVEPGLRIPLGFWERVVDDKPIWKDSNRPFEK